MQHWPSEHPHNTAVTYVPVDELAKLCAVGSIRRHNVVVPYSRDEVLEDWRRLGDKLDAYVLGRGRRDEACLRYGPAPGDYVRLYLEDTVGLRRLVAQHRYADSTRQQTEPSLVSQ